MKQVNYIHHWTIRLQMVNTTALQQEQSYAQYLLRLWRRTQPTLSKITIVQSTLFWQHVNKKCFQLYKGSICFQTVRLNFIVPLIERCRLCCVFPFLVPAIFGPHPSMWLVMFSLWTSNSDRTEPNSHLTAFDNVKLDCYVSVLATAMAVGVMFLFPSACPILVNVIF